MGSLICFVLPALMTITVTTVTQTRQKYKAQVSAHHKRCTIANGAMQAMYIFALGIPV